MNNLPSRIVFVDDDRPIRNLVQETLKRVSEDIVVVTCESGKEFLARLRELNPDLLLLDLEMPDMNGADVVERLRMKDGGQDIPVIFMTGNSKLQMTEEYDRLGVVGVLHKPFSPYELPNQIGELWTAHCANDLDV